MSLALMLDQAKALVSSLERTNEELTVLVKKNKEKEAELIALEKELGERREAYKILKDVQTARTALAKEKEALEEAKAAFENTKLSAIEALEKERAELAPMQALAEQVKTDRAALEQEKAEYKEKIKKELVAHLRNGKE